MLTTVCICGISVLHGQEIRDTIFSQTLEPVTIYQLKGSRLDKQVKLGHADWVQHDAGQVLLQVPGFSSIRKSGNFGFDPVFRGMKYDQLTILTDGGIAAHAACPNRMDPPSSQVMINQVRELEVLKGPHNFRYGPASGAVINFKTMDPVFSEKPKAFGRINSGLETNGGIFRTEGMIGLRTRKLEVSAAGSYSSGGDYRDGNDSIIPASFSRGALQVGLAYKATEHQISSLTVSRNFARNTEFPTLLMDLLSDDTWMVQAKHQVTSVTKWYSKWTTQLNTSLVDHQMGNGLRPASAAMLSHVFADTRTSGARTEFEVTRNRSRWYLGADWRQEYANGVRTRKMLTGMMAGKLFSDTLWQKGKVSRAGIFVQGDAKSGGYMLHVSVRTDLVSADAGSMASSFGKMYPDITRTDINTSLSVGMSRSFGGQFRAGLWLGRGVRSAGITERFIHFLPVGLDPYEVVGNPQLKPEVNNQLDVQLEYQKDQTRIRFSPYVSSVGQFITTVVDPALKPMMATAPGVRRFVNIDRALLLGYEFMAAHWYSRHIGNELALSYVRGTNKTLDAPLPEINPFEVRYTMKGRFWEERLLPMVSVRHVAAQNRVSEAFRERTTAAFTVVDLGFTVSVKQQWNVSCTVQNLLDVAYREHLSRFIRPTLPLNSIGRNMVLMAAYSF